MNRTYQLSRCHTVRPALAPQVLHLWGEPAWGEQEGQQRKEEKRETKQERCVVENEAENDPLCARGAHHPRQIVFGVLGESCLGISRTPSNRKPKNAKIFIEILICQTYRYGGVGLAQ